MKYKLVNWKMDRKKKIQSDDNLVPMNIPIILYSFLIIGLKLF